MSQKMNLNNHDVEILFDIADIVGIHIVNSILSACPNM